jgi:hypothetical protein
MTMSTMTIPSTPVSSPPVQQFFNDVRRGSPLLLHNAIAFMVGCAICFALYLVDHRLINGVNVWDKPTKFFVSLAVLLVTVAWAMSQLREPARGVGAAAIIMAAAAWFEMSYMLFRAARSEASHFNTGTPFAAIMYAFMGVASILLTSPAAFIGWRVWQQRGVSVSQEAAGLGLMLGALIGTIAGGYMSAQASHWVGGDMTDATGTGFFGWSTTGGDLRVAHFIGLHAMQIIPLAAISARRWVVYAVAAAITVAMAATFVMATNGIPIFRA